MRKRRIPFGILWLAAFSTAVGSLLYILGAPEQFSLPFRQKYMDHLLLVRTHGVAASLTLLLGPLQFSRTRGFSHRVLGYSYLLGSLVGALTALPLSFMALGGLGSQLGFLLMSLLWIITALKALQSARARLFREHRMWVIRSFSLAFGAVVLRFYLYCAEALGGEFYSIYPTSVWISWLPCLLAGEYAIQKNSPKVDLAKLS